MRTMNCFLLVCLSLAVAFPLFADDGVTKKQCLKDANDAYRDAVKLATENRKLAKLVCSARTPEEGACFQACFQTRSECLKPLNDAREACFDAVDAAFETGKSTCKTNAGCTTDCGGNRAYLTCMVDVRVTLYNSRKTCRTEDRVRDEARKVCRDTFRNCTKTCRNATKAGAR